MNCIGSASFNLAKFWTKQGIKILGGVVKRARVQRGWTLRDIERLTEQICEGAYTVSRDMMSELERGKRIPAHNTVVVIAELKFVLHPVTEKPFTEDELFDIGAEFLDPSTGRYNLGQREPTIPALIALELKNRFHDSQQLAVENLAAAANLESGRLEALISGERPTEEELVNLAQVLIKDDGCLWNEIELRDIWQKEFLRTRADGTGTASMDDLHSVEVADTSETNQAKEELLDEQRKERCLVWGFRD